MYIVMIAQSLYDFDARILRQSEALANNDNRVDIICLGNEQYPKSEKTGNITVYRVMNKFSQENIFYYILYSLIFQLKSSIKALGLLIKEKPDVIQVHNMPDYLVFAAIFHKIKRVPVVLDIHDLTVELFKEKWGKKKFKFFKPLLIAIEKLSTKFADRVITVSEQCGRKLMERGLPGSKLTIVMNVADSKSFTYYSEREFKKIERNLKLFYHGTIAERYGLDNTIIALPGVIEKIPGTVFYIFGKFDVEYRNFLEKLIQELKISENVCFKAPVPYESVSEEFKLADIGVITETILEYSNLGIPTKAFEYAAAGLPFIINDLQVNRSVFRDESVVFVHHNNTKQISDEIINLCLNPERRKKMSENALMM
jgi:glycosyltransferase involved in cell wall biosynthesis